MSIDTLHENEKSIDVAIPLTTPTGKVRVKQRDSDFDYGMSFASRKHPLGHQNYIEWQISYWAETSYWMNRFGNLLNTDIKDISFIGSDGKQKSLYELSEYCYHLSRWGIIERQALVDIQDSLQSLTDDDMLDKHPHSQVSRTHPEPKTIHGLDFKVLKAEYPLLIYRFQGHNIFAEIVTKEKQYAVGIQPMLYFCLPITELKSRGQPLIGRRAELKETALFTIDTSNSCILLEMIKIFGILSESHRHDIIAILGAILENT